MVIKIITNEGLLVTEILPTEPEARWVISDYQRAEGELVIV